MAIRAAHLSFQHWMSMRQLEFRAHFEVTLKASLGRLTWINYLVFLSTTLNMQAARTVAGFTTDVLRVVTLRL
jgi:hypothetical protein